MYLRRTWRSCGVWIALVALVLFFIDITVVYNAWFGGVGNGRDQYNVVVPSVFLILLLLSIGLAVFPGSEMPRRYIDEDLINYTGLSALEVLFGYVQAGMVMSGIVCVFGYVFLLPFCFFSFWEIFQTFLVVLLVFVFSQAMNLFSISFFSGVRKRYQFVFMGFTLYIFFLVGLMKIVADLIEFDRFYDDVHEFFIYYGFAWLFSVLLGCVGGYLTFSNASPRIPLFIRWLRVVMMYTMFYGLIAFLYFSLP